MSETLAALSAGKIVVPTTLIAGLIGSIISLRFAANLNWWERFTAVASGALMAQYCSPLVSHYLRIGEFQDTVGFFIGLFGLSLAAAIFDAIKSIKPWDFIMSRWGG